MRVHAHTRQADRPGVLRDHEWRFAALEFLVTEFQTAALLAGACPHSPQASAARWVAFPPPHAESPPLCSPHTEIRARPPAALQSSSTAPAKPEAEAAANGPEGASESGKATSNPKDAEQAGQQEQAALTLALSDLYKLHGRALRKGVERVAGVGPGSVTVDAMALIQHVRSQRGLTPLKPLDTLDPSP